MYGLVLIAIIAVMGGAIAYIGDKLGTKVGKKKLTIFGLRPKHTSILVTIITGILISASTLGILTISSQDVRTALFGMEALKNELTQLSIQAAQQNKELFASRSELQAKTAEYTAVTAKIEQTVRQLAVIGQELSQVTAERDQAAQALSRVQTDYTQAREDLIQSQNDINSLQATKAELDNRVAVLNEAKTTLQSDVDRLNELTENLKKGIEAVREGTVIFRAGEVLSTAVIKGGSPREDAEKLMGKIIFDTNRGIMERLNIKENMEVLWIATADYQQAANFIASTPESIIVRISAAGNIIYGEPVVGRIDLFPNRLIYEAGSVVYSEKMEINKNSREAEEFVMAFLNKVNSEAIKQGMLPDPLRGTVGSMSGSQFFETINKIKRYNGRIEISAVTTEDIHTAGPLTVNIRIKELP